MLAKTANQHYRDYKAGGGSLSFKDWVSREKEKSIHADGAIERPFIINDTLTRAVEDMHRAGGQKSDMTKGYTLGMPTWVWLVGSGALLATITVAYTIKKRK